MIAFGSGGATPKQRMSQLSAGLGLLRGVIVDQHFEQRNRYGRLLSLVAQSPALLGLGIDEDTALETVQEARPEIYAKGGDYVMTEIPEGKAVLAVGGKAVAIDFEHDRSTTKLVAKIRQFGG